MTTPFSDFVTFFTAVSRCFLPALLFFAIICAIWKKQEYQELLRTILAVCGAIIAGMLLAKFTIAIRYFSELSLLLSALLLIWGVFSLLASFINNGKLATIGFTAFAMPFLLLLFMQAAIDLWIIISDEALSSTGVVNTTLIINGGALLLSFTAMVFVGTLFTIFFRRISFGSNRILFIILIFLPGTQWTANLLINLIRLDYLTATKENISYVAKAHDALFLWNYLFFVIAAIGIAFFFAKRHRRLTDSEKGSLPEPEQRKRIALKLTDTRRMTIASTVLLIALALQGWYDMVVNKPPELSPAIPVTVDKDDLVRIKIADVSDGSLHRYSYITADGYRVRFFIIQRYENSNKFGVVFDACQICGDDGYLESNKNVICIACNVSIFIPSIGKPGGCNPIPFPSEMTEDEIIIKKSTLEDGANYFSEKVEIMVKDPVTGKELSNIKAPFHYSYKGHEFSFESEESMKKFVDDPEKFVQVKRRSVRIDGYKEQ